MLNYNEILELKEKLVNGEIAVGPAQELYWKDFKEGKRSWHTKDWKERGAKVIKDKCQICGGKETLTIQHLSHPQKYNEYEKEITRKYTRSFIDSNTVVDKSEFTDHLLNKYDYEPVPLCPNCESRKPNSRKRKTPQFLCTDCKYEFDTPINKPVNELVETFYKNKEAIEVRDKCFVSKDKWRNQHNLSNAKYWFQREQAKVKDIEKIKKEAFLLYLDATIKYLSFEETITACKKCAFNFDINNMELCPKCNKNYKGVKFPTCIQCLPEKKRKAAFKKIEFGKEWHDMHKRLGID
jgi:hypothetical protein